VTEAQVTEAAVPVTEAQVTEAAVPVTEAQVTVEAQVTEAQVTEAQVTVAQVTATETAEVMGLASALAAMVQAVATAVSEMADPVTETLLVVSRPEKGTVPARPVRLPEFPLVQPPPVVDLRAESRTFFFF
ncbi:MAG: hypothetical protein H0U53_07660, partial [Actinobacteria bacterium]|nr:hypothetical protein [Actinomycetota bacterium]